MHPLSHFLKIGLALGLQVTSSSMLLYEATPLLRFLCLDCCYGLGMVAHVNLCFLPLEYDLFVLNLLIEDPSRVYTLLEGMRLFMMEG